MEIIPNGTEVLIFKYIREYIKEDNENYIVGIVQSSKKSHDLSYHGSPWYVQIYEVLGEDGKIYRGNYGSAVIGNTFFRTKEDYIGVLKRMIFNNEQEILKLNEKNGRYLEQITMIENELKCDVQTESLITKKLIQSKQNNK